MQTRRLLLRPLTEADTEGLLAYRSLADVCRWVPFEPMDEGQIAERLSGVWSRTTLDAEGQALALGVELAQTGELAGDVFFQWSSEKHRCGEVGYVFDPRFRGQGYATEAVSAVLALAFDGLGLHRVVARVDARNTASARLATRVGMRQEARLIENEWFKGEWSDELDFALLDREWCARATQTDPSG